MTLPGRPVATGHRHVLTQTSEEIEDIFIGMGYQVVDGFEVEQDYYNFERMNLPKDHPARDMQDTFYITEEILLRTHTSPVQARAMDAHDFSKGPLKMISPGVYSVGILTMRPTATSSIKLKDWSLGKHFYGGSSRNASVDRAKDVWCRTPNPSASFLLPIYRAIC